MDSCRFPPLGGDGILKFIPAYWYRDDVKVVCTTKGLAFAKHFPEELKHFGANVLITYDDSGNQGEHGNTIWSKLKTQQRSGISEGCIYIKTALEDTSI